MLPQYLFFVFVQWIYESQQSGKVGVADMLKHNVAIVSEVEYQQTVAQLVESRINAAHNL